jgi:hypothetical protein
MQPDSHVDKCGAVHRLEPSDPGWLRLLSDHPDSSVFHTQEWANALLQTYGHRTCVLTTSPPGQAITNGVVLTSIDSRLTGRRLVSVPFADHCEPLAASQDNAAALCSGIVATLAENRFGYAELRPIRQHDASYLTPFHASRSFALHKLQLSPTLNQLFASFHKDCIQRKILRAERERLEYDEGTDDSLLRRLYSLMLLTRRRQAIAIPPFSWFRNLVACMGHRAKVRIALKAGQPVASILTLQHERTMVYKYGSSDDKFHAVGGIPFLLWRAIRDAKSENLHEFDFGRTDLYNHGLLKFKDRWGACRTPLTYWRFPVSSQSNRRAVGLTNRICAVLPDVCMRLVVEMLYRHVG